MMLTKLMVMLTSDQLLCRFDVLPLLMAIAFCNDGILTITKTLIGYFGGG